MPVLILAIAIATGALFWFLGVPWLRSRRRLALSRQPILPQWREWLSVGVPAYAGVPLRDAQGADVRFVDARTASERCWMEVGASDE